MARCSPRVCIIPLHLDLSRRLVPSQTPCIVHAAANTSDRCIHPVSYRIYAISRFNLFTQRSFQPKNVFLLCSGNCRSCLHCTRSPFLYDNDGIVHSVLRRRVTIDEPGWTGRNSRFGYFLSFLFLMRPRRDTGVTAHVMAAPRVVLVVCNINSACTLTETGEAIGIIHVHA